MQHCSRVSLLCWNPAVSVRKEGGQGSRRRATIENHAFCILFSVILNLFFLVPVIHGDCFAGKGEKYLGFTNTTASGEACERWDRIHYPNMKEAHNFCRNRGGKSSAPWCFAKEGDTQRKQSCNIPRCSKWAHNWSKLFLLYLTRSSYPIVILVYGNKSPSCNFSFEWQRQEALISVHS